MNTSISEQLKPNMARSKTSDSEVTAGGEETTKQVAETTATVETVTQKVIEEVAKKTFSVFEKCAFSLAWNVLSKKKGTAFDNYSKFYGDDEMEGLYKIRINGEVAYRLAINFLLATGFEPKTGDKNALKKSIIGKDFSELEVPPVTGIESKLFCILVDMASRETIGSPFHNGAWWYDRDQMNALYDINLKGDEAAQRALEWAEAQGYRQIVPEKSGTDRPEEIRAY